VATYVQHPELSYIMNIPIHPTHPERICWGCDKFCPALIFAAETEVNGHSTLKN
jgi:hypothetical protein